MARIRSLKPEAFQSETLADVSLAAERTFFGLSTQVDDRGRIADKPASINGALWAERSERDEHTAADLDLELKELEAVGAICRYVGCDGKRYLHLVTWDEHQRVDKPSKPRTPRCPRHQAAPDECGKHAKGHEKEPCPEIRDPSRRPREGSGDAREGSGVLDSHQSDANAAGSGETAHVDWVDSAEEGLAPVVALRPPTDQHEHKPLANARGASRDLPEGSMTYDRGSRTEDLSAPSADACASEEQGVLIIVREPPKRKPRKKPAPSPEHPIAEELANGYWARYQSTTSQSWIAVRQVVLQALKNGADRNELAFALDLIGREENPVTANILTIARKRVRAERNRGSGTELAPASRTTTDRRQQATDDRYARAMQRAMEKEQAS